MAERTSRNNDRPIYRARWSLRNKITAYYLGVMFFLSVLAIVEASTRDTGYLLVLFLGFLFLCLVLIPFLFVAIPIRIDAVKHGMNASRWAMIAWCVPLVGELLYFSARAKKARSDTEQKRRDGIDLNVYHRKRERRTEPGESIVLSKLNRSNSAKLKIDKFGQLKK